MRRNPESIVHRKADKGHISFRRDRMQVDQAEAASRTVGRVRKNSIRAKDADRLAKADLADHRVGLHAPSITVHMEPVQVGRRLVRIWPPIETYSSEGSIDYDPVETVPIDVQPAYDSLGEPITDEDLDALLPWGAIDPSAVYTLYNRNDPVLGLPESGFSEVSPDSNFSALSAHIRAAEDLF